MPHGDGSPAQPGQDADEVMGLLAEHVPLALLLDLAASQGPASDEILRTEGVPDDAWWEPEVDGDSGAEAESVTEPTAGPAA